MDNWHDIESVSLAERIADWCPFTDSPDGCTDTCPWPLHALEAEAKALEYEVGHWQAKADARGNLLKSAEARVEALEAVLRSAPEPPPRGNINEHSQVARYRVWWQGTRAAALADEPRKETR